VTKNVKEKGNKMQVRDLIKLLQNQDHQNEVKVEVVGGKTSGYVIEVKSAAHSCKTIIIAKE